MIENWTIQKTAKFRLGEVVKHRHYDFRGIIFDVDPEFSHTDEWYESIPEHIRPDKDQPFYHLFAVSSDQQYIAYVSEQNLVQDISGTPIQHPEIEKHFMVDDQGQYLTRPDLAH
ncbi:MAG: heat shock protein HspQ [Gammaproteobacteria bacterium]|nr:heat shock protein HspQ [Gammaproteobacteria bacterium]MCY4227748.1 heat shock protein HspQ [Gammaproteobacteria bacterium]MCY4313288.1 heat shock protein HspQ [Gammaproteobacteria bacterium]